MVSNAELWDCLFGCVEVGSLGQIQENQQSTSQTLIFVDLGVRPQTHARVPDLGRIHSGNPKKEFGKFPRNVIFGHFGFERPLSTLYGKGIEEI